MKRNILISILISMLLTISNLCMAEITKKEKSLFDYHIKRVEKSRESYKIRKEAERERKKKQAKQKRAEGKRKRELKNKAKKNSRLERERQIRDTNRRVNDLEKGQCTISEVTGKYICK